MTAVDIVDRAQVHLEIYEQTMWRRPKPIRRQDWRRCGLCRHAQVAHRCGPYLGSCSCCNCAGWKASNPWRALRRAVRWLIKGNAR